MHEDTVANITVAGGSLEVNVRAALAEVGAFLAFAVAHPGVPFGRQIEGMCVTFMCQQEASSFLL